MPSRFSYQHVLLLLIDAIIFFLVIFLLRKKSQKFQRNFLIILNIICAIIFAGRMFFGWEGARIYNEGTKSSLLPLELCNINIYISLIALISNKKFLNNYMYLVTMVGGMIPLIVFPDCHMITNGNNLFHYMFFDYWIIHSSLVFIPIAMLCWKFFTPDIKSIYKVTLLVAGIYLFDFIACLILRNFEMFNNANYMYCMNHNNLPILRDLYALIPYPFLYGLPLAIPISIVFVLMCLPFYLCERKKRKC